MVELETVASALAKVGRSGLLVNVDATASDGRALAATAGVRAYPTLAVYRNGVKVPPLAAPPLPALRRVIHVA